MKRPIRRGFSVIEMVVALTILAGLLIAGGVLLTSLLHLDRAERFFTTEALALDRLALEFRRDARAATVAKPCPEGIDLIGPDGVVVSYNFTKGRITRDETVDQTATRSETFAITTNARALWEIESSNGLKILKLSIVFGSKNAIKRYPFRVEAILGAARRFESRKTDASSR